VVADGGFGNNTVAVMVVARGFHLISKLQYNAISPPLMCVNSPNNGHVL
jgi:hypothetical protein